MKEELFASTSCIILSAGNSNRMGVPKALLKFDEHTTFIQKITDTYIHAGIKQLVVVVNEQLFEQLNESNIYLSPEVKLVINNNPELGRFLSLQTGLHAIKHGNSCIFQNIDNPFTSVGLIEKLISHKDDADVVIPAFQNKSGHPVLINTQVAEQILLQKDSEIRIDGFLKNFNVKKVEVGDHTILVNINSREEYFKAGFKFKQ